MFSSVSETYENYKSELKIAQRFYAVTCCSYNLCTALSDEEISFDDRVLNSKTNKKEFSYSPADAEYMPKLSCEWITLLEYAHREKISIEQVEKDAKLGVYGEVVNNDGKEYIIWPSKYQFIDKKPIVSIFFRKFNFCRLASGS